MATTEVKYLGLDLKSPVIVSSCSLTADVDKVKEMQRAGAGAVVMKSLFEEQIRGEVEFMASAGHSYPEMDDYAGADALEINLYDPAVDPRTSPASIEEGYISVIRSIVSELRIPVDVKIGQHYTSIVNFADRLASCGAKGVVIFNRFFRPDIDIENFRLVPAAPLSHEGEYGETLRWTAILSSVVKTDIAVTTGIHTPETAIKMILAGAAAVQICSVIYQKGVDVIAGFNDRIQKFLEDNNVGSLSQIRGRLDYSTIADPALYERVQFMKTFGSLAL